MIHVVVIICWFSASVNWAVSFNRLKKLLDDLLIILPSVDCFLEEYKVLNKYTDSAVYVQAQIAVVSLGVDPDIKEGWGDTQCMKAQWR